MNGLFGEKTSVFIIHKPVGNFLVVRLAPLTSSPLIFIYKRISKNISFFLLSGKTLLFESKVFKRYLLKEFSKTHYQSDIGGRDQTKR